MNVNTQLDPVLTSVNKAKGLPNEHYVNDEIFNEEKRSVLFKNWSGIGVAKDIPEMGDAKPIDFLGMPLLIVRDRDGNVGVFQNTCRHRGMILVKEPGKIRGAIRCPYHSWCYDLNGALRATPHVGGPGHNKHEDIKNEDLGLFRIRSHVWQDVIFVNISGDADEFQKVHCDLLQRWREFDQPIYHGGKHSSFKLEVKTNWKLAVENYCESYHLPWIHPGLNSYSKLEDHYNIEAPLKYSGQGTLVYRQLKSEDGAVFPDFIDLSKQWNEGAEYIAVYPNVLMGFHRDHFFSILLEPVDTNQTIEHVELYYPKKASASAEYEELRTTNAEQWKAIFEEDLFVVEGMQKGRNGVLFDGGKFSPAMDGPTHNFHFWVATQIAEGRTQESN
jgi:choline monooxygenase